MKNDIIKDVGDYYTQKIKDHGVSPKGVDWSTQESQDIRYDQLLKVITSSSGFSVLDYGTGYGGLLDYMESKGYENFDFTGFDISDEMLAKAKENHNSSKATWVNELTPEMMCDFVVASGVLNVKLSHSTQDWKSYVFDTINKFDLRSKKGFAFNVLTKYSDADRMIDKLYYADPEELFAYCKTRFSRNVALLHDYELYEFTIIVRKEI